MSMAYGDMCTLRFTVRTELDPLYKKKQAKKKWPKDWLNDLYDD